MNDRDEEQKLIRSYLLHELTEEERQAVEKRLMADDDFSKAVLLAEDDLIDDYVQGELSADERKKFEAAILSTPEGRQQVDFTTAFREYVAQKSDDAEQSQPITPHQSTWWQRLFASPTWRLATAFVVILAAGLGIWRIFFYESDLDKGLAALKKAYRAERPFEARITDFDYAPPPAETRGKESESLDKPNQRLADSLISAAVVDHPSAKSLYASGKLYLAKRDFQNAIDELERARQLAPDDAHIFADLGTAYFEQGKALDVDGKKPESKELFAISLSHLNKALHLDPFLLTVRFNRALVFQELKLAFDAEADWRAYLEKDPDSPWAEEAKQKLKQLQEQTEKSATTYDQLYLDFLSAFESKDERQGWAVMSQCYEEGWNTIVDRLLLDHFASMANQQAAQGSTTLAALEFAANAEYRGCGDLLTSDLARYYRSASVDQKDRLRQAQAFLNLAKKESANSNLRGALNYYLQAKTIFNREGSVPQSQYIEHRIAHCYIWDDLDKAAASFNRLLKSCEERTYLTLAARVSEVLSLAYGYSKETSKYLESTHRSLAIHKRTGNVRGTIYGYIQLAGLYQEIGDPSRSLDYFSRSLDLIGHTFLTQKDLALSYRSISGGFALRQHYDAAIAYQKECLRFNLNEGNPVIIARAYTFLADLYRKIGNDDEAIKNLHLALAIGQQVADEQTRQDSVSYTLRFLGDAYRHHRDFGLALKCYDQAIEINERQGRIPQTYYAHKGKLFCFIAQNDDANARREIHTTLKLYEENRSKILEDSNKISYGEQEQPIYDIAIDYEFSKANDPASAFDLCEASHARSFLDLVSHTSSLVSQDPNIDVRSPSSAPSLKLEELRKRIPEQTQLLQYAVLHDKVLIWLVTSSGWIAVISPVPSQDLSDKVTQYLQNLSTPNEDSAEEINKLSMDLFRALIEPIESHLGSEKTLCIVADKFLHHLPFAALLSPTTGAYLIEEYPLIHAPSTNIFISYSEEAQKRAMTDEERLFIVGNPSFDREQFPNFADLLSAQKEAQKIARYYNHPVTAYARQATEEVVKREMGSCTVLHFATHYVADDRSPLRSKFLLSKPPADVSGREDGIFEAREIYAMKLPKARLAVLAACQTGIERSYQGEGAVGIARPFLASGVPLVIASLWKVDSDSTSELMVKFHQHYKEGKLEPAAALRQAQRQMLADTSQRFHHPYHWAPFVAIGGYAHLNPKKETDYAAHN